MRRVSGGMPIYGTCAGAILLSKKTTGEKSDILKLLDIDTARNAYGRQVESFSTQISAPEISQKPIPAVFIRAPKIIRVGKNVEILARFRNEPVLVREKNILASTFHPELTDDLAVHRYFIRMSSGVVPAHRFVIARSPQATEAISLKHTTRCIP